MKNRIEENNFGQDNVDFKSNVNLINTVNYLRDLHKASRLSVAKFQCQFDLLQVDLVNVPFSVMFSNH